MKVQQKKRNRSEENATNGQNHENKKEDSPNFLLKLYTILETPEYQNIIHWSDNGKYFVVQNLHDFTENILNKYYKHNNYSSFVRQLNMYDFHKKRSNQNEHIFQHKLFTKGQKDLIPTIKRKNRKEFHPISGDLAFPDLNGQNNKNNEQALIEYFNNDVPKKATKSSLEKALNYPLTELDIRKQIDRLGSTVYKFSNLVISMDEDTFVSNKDLNDIRRDACALLDAKRQYSTNYTIICLI